MAHLTALERAFDLARTGKFATLSEIRNQLKVERYDISQLEGRALQKQLREVCAEARKIVVPL